MIKLGHEYKFFKIKSRAKKFAKEKCGLVFSNEPFSDTIDLYFDELMLTEDEDGYRDFPYVVVWYDKYSL